MVVGPLLISTWALTPHAVRLSPFPNTYRARLKPHSSEVATLLFASSRQLLAKISYQNNVPGFHPARDREMSIPG